MCALHMLPQYTHQQANSTFLATDFHCKWLFSECFQAKYIPHRKRFLYHVFNIFIKSNESCVLCAHPSLLPSAWEAGLSPWIWFYSSLCLWCMKRRVYSYRDWPLAGLLMGYGPQLHLFRWISLLGSAREHHVRACNREVMGRQWFERQQRSSLISRMLFQQPFKNQT